MEEKTNTAAQELGDELGQALVDMRRQLHRAQVHVQDARHALFEVGDYELGAEPGSFTTLLMRAYRRADASNRLKVWREWPGLAVALDEALTEQGLDWLRDLVKAAKS